MLSKEDIEEIVNMHPWLKPPKYIYVLNAPVIYPELKAKVLGMNPAFERDTIILSRDATPETVVHECVPPTTKVITDSGVKNISEVRVGDKVLDHTKYYHRVTDVIKLWHEGPMYKILTTHIHIPLYVTPNHPIFVRKKKQHEGGFLGKFNTWKTGWVFPSQLDSSMELVVPNFKPNHLSDREKLHLVDFLGDLKPVVEDGYIVKIHNRGPNKVKNKIPSVIPITNDLMELLGWYVAEGSHNGRSIRMHLGKDEKNIAEKLIKIINDIFGVESRIDEPPGYRGIKVIANSSILSEIFGRWFGHNCYSKRLPLWLMSLKREYIEIFLKSYIMGDGNIGFQYTRKGNKYPRITITTVSSSLAYQTYIIMMRCGLVPQLEYIGNGSGFKENSPQYRIRSQSGNIDEFLGIDMNRDTKIKAYAHLRGPASYLFLKINGIELINYRGYVYNLEIEGSQSYTADLRTVHNCLHVSGFGELVAYPFGRILTRFRNRFKPIIKRQIRYKERKLDSDELKKYGLYAYSWKDGFKPADLEVTVLERIDDNMNLQYRYSDLPKACKCVKCGYVIENPGVHCINMTCPKCGGQMRRVT